ncbi:flagellar M-ring protein FliF [Rosenbergiella sp. S61]|uniref:Flagellar M-ring protein n=1 Tax=Rosenbergiella gaditana TaxID=2726987 RepID=A0ABS5T190_9GAMM|nr:flagellar basal-body MS-ring/collar protein FliF [Rosenbergiella gaditana]MBT0725222.1 flagellar M-ring protein FliF [Rosenbergiella gaditana]
MLDSLNAWFAKRNFSIELLKKPWVLALAGGVLTLLIVTTLWRGQVDYVPLYGAHQRLPNDAVASALAAEQIDFRINPENGQVLVADNVLPRARMVLAGKNIQPIVAPGFELMDKDEVLGASQYIQNIRYQRGLEGELARSIMSLQGVEEARVHLGIQAESGFVLSNQPASSGSVLVTLAPGIRLTSQQVRAITQLVAGSVPGLTAGNIHIVDQTGALLNDSTQDTPSVTPDIIRSISQPITQNLTQILDSAVGQKNYRVTVMPDIDFRRTEETQETYQGDPKVLEEQLNNDSSDQAMASGLPGTLSNRPTTATSNTADAPKLDRTVSQTQRKYAYDHQIKHINYPVQQLAKLQIAVALNTGTETVAKMSESQLAQLKSLLENAAGIDDQRGDKLTLDKLAFIAPVAVSVPTLSWWQQPDIQFWAIWGGIGVLVILIILFILRPTVKAIIAQRSANVTTESPANTDRGVAASGEKHQFENESDLPPRASGIEDKVSYLQQLAANETDRVAEVIKQWINSNDRPRDNV